MAEKNSPLEDATGMIVDINYYRLTPYDFDGQKETFDAVSVDVKSLGT